MSLFHSVRENFFLNIKLSNASKDLMFMARWCQKKEQNREIPSRSFDILSKELHRPRYRMRDVEDMLVSQEFHASFMRPGRKT